MGVYSSFHARTLPSDLERLHWDVFGRSKPTDGLSHVYCVFESITARNCVSSKRCLRNACEGWRVVPWFVRLRLGQKERAIYSTTLPMAPITSEAKRSIKNTKNTHTGDKARYIQKLFCIVHFKVREAGDRAPKKPLGVPPPGFGKGGLPERKPLHADGTASPSVEPVIIS